MINKMFTPEFRNRLDSIIRFGALDETTISHVVDKFIVQLETQLADKNVVLDVIPRHGSGLPETVMMLRWVPYPWQG